MKRFVLLAARVLLVPGCLANLGLQIDNTGVSATQPSVGPRGSFSSSSVNARVSDGLVFGTVIGVGVLGVLFGGERRAAPELDATRTVRERDCTKPVENPGANLRCR